MLDLWLRTNPRPTIADLRVALEQSTVGFHQLAEKLEMDCLKRDKTKNTIKLFYICETCKTKFTCPQCSKGNTARSKSSKSIKVILHMLLTIVLFIGVDHTRAYISPNDCFATGKGLTVAEIGERADVILHVVDQKQRGYIMENETITCEITHRSTGNKLDCAAKKSRGNQYVISYQPTSRGRHQLHVKVEGEHIKGSPFTITVVKKITNIKPIRVIEVESPRGISLSQWNELFVLRPGHILIFNSSMEKKEFYILVKFFHNQMTLQWATKETY